MLIAKVLPLRRPLVRNATLPRKAIVSLAAGLALGTLGWMTGAVCAVAQTSGSAASTPATTPSPTSAQDSARAAALAAAQAQAAAQAAAMAQAKGKKKAKPDNPATQVKQSKPATQVKQSRQAKPPKPAKQAKNVYTGPNTVEVLAPAPMLDDEGKQRVDTDGKPMYYPPVQQTRDKKGHPMFDRTGQPVFQTARNMGYDEKGKRIQVKKEKAPRRTPVSIRSGTLTVDGWTGKAQLNYDIHDLKYLYVYVPGIGTTIVAPSAFPGATAQAGAFKDNTLRITVEGHPIELSSEKELLGKKPQEAWVAVDRQFLLPEKFPVLGYGMTLKAPYVWPGSKQEVEENGVAKAPPLPVDLLPTPLLAPCPAGMMREAGTTALPGQKAPQQPCVPIQSRGASTAAAKATPSAAGTLSTAPAQPPQ